MKYAVLVIDFALGLILTACRDEATPIEPETVSQFGITHVTASATGSGHIYRHGTHLRTFSFAAIEREDGTAIGNWRVVNPGCLRIIFAVEGKVVRENAAYLGGRRTDDRRPSIFQVMDNGEDSANPPAQISLTSTFTNEDLLPQYSENPWSRTLFDDAHGDVQVRGEEDAADIGLVGNSGTHFLSTASWQTNCFYRAWGCPWRSGQSATSDGRAICPQRLSDTRTPDAGGPS